jgi:polyphosphate kinase
MAQTMISILRVPVLLLVGLFVLPSTSLAHRLDEYLQATLVTIAPAEIRLQINLTPGVAVAEQVLSRIDRNRDSVISTNEATAYATLLMRDLSLRLDQRKVDLKLTSSNFPAPTELRTGLGIIQIEFSANISSLPGGAHTLLLENRHLRTLSVYLFNAAQPRSASVYIIRQKRNETQSTGEIEFTIS